MKDRIMSDIGREDLGLLLKKEEQELEFWYGVKNKAENQIHIHNRNTINLLTEANEEIWKNKKTKGAN